MIDLATLNQEQGAAVAHTEGPLLLIAGAGTGKTRVITYRMAYMLNSGIAPQRIAAMTFTNKAAREMRERLTDLVGARAKSIFIGTIHRFCLQILRHYHQAADLNKNFRIIASSDQLDLVRRSLEEKGWAGQYRPESVHAAISYAKNQLWDGEELALQSEIPACPYDPGVIAAVMAVYERQLTLNHVIDFDDCMAKVAKLLKTHSDIQKTLADQYRYLMVDEFQDTNMAQLAVIHGLARTHENLCVVGDDDQSIYSWRGAVTEIFQIFEDYFPKRKLIKLEQNYRCTNIILNTANTVIKHNTQRKDKTLWSSKDITQPITLATLADENDEAQWIADKCLAYLGRGHRAPDIGILYRTNSQARAIEIALREARLPYKVFGGQSLFERKEVKDVLSYLRVLANPNDRMAFLRIINTPTRGFGLKTLENLENLAKQKKQSLFQALKENVETLPKRIIKPALNFLTNVEELKQLPLETPDDARALVQQLIRAYRLETDIRTKHKEKSLADRKLTTLRSIPDWFSDMAERQLGDGERLTLADLLDQLLLDTSDKSEDEENRNYVSLMTIHAAKGLEFPIVFLAGLEEGLLPHQNSVEDEGSVSEERRLFYVAITRAKELLHLSLCQERRQANARVPMDPSRFCAELPDEHLSRDLEGATSAKVPDGEKKQRTLRKLASLRSEFK